ADRVDNQLDVFSKAFLGLTVACARCHDHKFDAITTKDYYALAGYLQSSRRQLAFLDDPAPLRQQIGQHRRLQERLRTLLSATPTEEAAPADPRPGDAVFADFRRDGFQDWFVWGEAFGARPSRSGDLLLQADASRPVRLLVAPGLAHSALVSGRLQGALRSPTFVLSKKQIHYRVPG